MEEGSHRGLGYFQHGHHLECSTSADGTDNPLPVVDLAHQPLEGTENIIIQNYLKECVEYHEEQERVRQGLPAPLPMPHAPSLQEPTVSHLGDLTAPQTEHPQVPELLLQYDCPFVGQSQIEHFENDYYFSTEQYSRRPVPLKSAVQRAQDIVRKFQAQEEALVNIGAPSHPTTMSDAIIYPNHMASLPELQRIRAHQREQRRLEEALIKNFDYISRKANQQYNHTVVRLQTTTTAPVMSSLGHPQIKGLQSQAGVGTKQRKQVERRKEKVGATVFSNTASLAMYFSGIPKNEESDSSNITKLLTQIFEAYGKVEKIHLYRDRESNQIKGDGIVVYETVPGRKAMELVECLVSQVNRMVAYGSLCSASYRPGEDSPLL